MFVVPGDLEGSDDVGVELRARLAMQLDCNRASGRWEAHPSGPGAGALVLNAPAMTRAMCVGPSWDNRLAADLAGARGYALEGERLSVTLENHGVYVWRRLPASP